MLSKKFVLGFTLGAACFTLCPLARGDAPAAGTARDEAKAQYTQGVAAYQAGRYHDAIERFLSADRIEPSAALSYNIARAYEKLGEPPRALEFYRDYLRRGAAPSHEPAIQARVRELEAVLRLRKVQQVTLITEPPGADVRIDGRARGATPFSVELTPGNHELVLRKQGFGEVRRAFLLEPDRALDVTVKLVSPPPESLARSPTLPRAPVPAEERVDADRLTRDSPVRRALPWVTLGLGGAALAGAGVFELLRDSAEEDANTRPQIENEEHRERAESRKTTARVLTGVGAALVVGGGVWVYVDAQRRASARANAALTCTPSSCFGTLRVRF